MSGQIGLTVYSADAVSRMTTAQLRDSLSYFSPDVVAVARPQHERQLRQALSSETPTVVTERTQRTVQRLYSSASVDLVRVAGVDSLGELVALEGDGVSVSGETYVLSDLLSVDLDLVNLETRLDGREAYEAAVPDDLSGSYTHLTTEANPGYRNDWGSLAVQGAMPGANERQGQTAPGIAHLRLRADGVVCTRTRSPEQFGLRALEQVGETRAQTLREAGFRSREAVAAADLTDLRELTGFGRETARTVIESATATVEGTVRRYGDEGFPGADPVFIDIETDGLNPTMIWLIGALDASTDEYRSFLAREEPAAALEAFLSWLQHTVGSRPVVAYNGRSFDFPVIEEQLAEHCPQYLDVWDDIWTFDPYYWATTRDQALLPGRTNKLGDVAAALGWDDAGTGLTGAAVARLFQRWQANPCEATELDWERHERYCEDDVRALAYVYDALAEASRTHRAGTDTSATGSDTTQGQLSDF
ncbi:hypothetical protein GRX03_10340 [Halovenus sp. WSH3]|uniref:YprB ribonuclease H-like domain-containing protein n=1 Tax=Halovenus carboxidivorans TaxID=2692199 RepID=A0A6B0T211_9EURY|nr:ribonuclease H-like domain-containing protein [Halovenus carboxidivorans]MXR51995.1 hypothetical protein [Halovenus carboxidivorans]